MSLAKEIIETITEFAKNNKPTQDPSCIRKFNKINWKISIDETKIIGKFSWEKGRTWTEPFGTVENHSHWFCELDEHLNKKYPFGFIYHQIINSESGIEIISWGTKEEITKKSKELAEKIRIQIIDFMKNNPIEIKEPFIKFAKGHKFLTLEWKTIWEDCSDCEEDYDEDHYWNHACLNGHHGDVWEKPDNDLEFLELEKKFPEEAKEWYHNAGPYGSWANHDQWYKKLVKYLNKIYPELSFEHSISESALEFISWSEVVNI